MSEHLSCPRCGADFSIEELFGNEIAHRAVAHLAVLSIPLGARVLAYTRLFAPPKNRLTVARQVKLIAQLLPDLQRQAITHNGREWEAPLAAWALAIDGMLQQRDDGKLRLPLTSHAYLYAVLAGMADKVERADEQQREKDRRNRGGMHGSADVKAVLDELGPELRNTQAAIAARPPIKTHNFKSAADVLAANPHLKGATRE